MISDGGGGDRRGRSTTGRYLERRSAITKRVQALARPLHVLLVEDNEIDARKFITSLRVLLGDKIATSHARTTAEMVRAASRSQKPDAVVVDDRLPTDGTAEQSVAALRSVGFAGPIVVVSGLLVSSRRLALSRLDVAAVLDKDQADSLTIAELILAGIG